MLSSLLLLIYNYFVFCNVCLVDSKYFYILHFECLCVCISQQAGMLHFMTGLFKTMFTD